MKMIFDDEEAKTEAKKYMEEWEFELERDTREIQDYNDFFRNFDLEECFQNYLRDSGRDAVIELSESQKANIYGIYIAKAKKAIEEEAKIDKFIEDCAKAKIDKFIEDCAKAMLNCANKYGLKNSDGEDYTIDVFKENVSNFVYSRYDY